MPLWRQKSLDNNFSGSLAMMDTLNLKLVNTPTEGAWWIQVPLDDGRLLRLYMSPSAFLNLMQAMVSHIQNQQRMAQDLHVRRN